MPVDWDAETEQFSGDVRLNNRTETPVGLRGAEDVYVEADSVTGTLRIVDAEYVYTGIPATGTPDPDDPAVQREVTGNLEDGYVEDVVGTAAVGEAEDVFVEHGAAETLETTGVEQVFHDDTAAPTMSPDDYEVSVSGWKRSESDRDPRNGVSVVGAKNEVTVSEAKHDLAVCLTGWDNEVEITGRNLDVTVYFVGRDNRVSVGPYVNATVGAECGADNELDRAPLPPEAVIQTTKSEAYDDAFFGRRRLTFQEGAPDKDWCPNCGESSDAIITRRQKDAFFLFGIPIWTFDEGGESYECEVCTRHSVEGVDLDPDERKDALR
jgi:hypothetical protein